jgi:hypothetical protein
VRSEPAARCSKSEIAHSRSPASIQACARSVRTFRVPVIVSKRPFGIGQGQFIHSGTSRSGAPASR